MKKGFIGRIMTVLLSMIIVASMMPAAAFAEGRAASEVTGAADRTIMLYACGSNLESAAAMVTYNLHQILNAGFSKDERVRFIVLTGGSEKWQTESKYLCDSEGRQLDEISPIYNQIWEIRGKDAPVNAGKMVLLDGDGLSGDGDAAKPSEEELMSDPETLRAFINYGVQNFPADKYDLILWDHGGGPLGDSFASDEHGGKMMSFSKLVDAIAHNMVTDRNSDGVNDGRFDFVDFDACLMNSIELDYALADYMDYYIASPETEPGYGQYYTGWLDRLGEDPAYDTFELGMIMVDDFISFYDDEESDGAAQDGTLAVIDMNRLRRNTGLSSSLRLMAYLMAEQASNPDKNGEFLFYDEVFSARESIEYGMSSLYDLGNFASLIGVPKREMSPERIRSYNLYTYLADDIIDALDDERLIYARGTRGIESKSDVLYRDRNGDTGYGKLGTSGISIFFTPLLNFSDGMKYCKELAKVLKNMPVKDDGRYAFLEQYRLTTLRYYLMGITGYYIDFMMYFPKVDGAKDEVIKPEDIDYELLKEEWTSGTGKTWTREVKPALDELGGEDAVKGWLDQVIKQQAKEAVVKDNVSVRSVRYKDGNGYKITVDHTRNRMISEVKRDVFAHIPVAEKALEEDEDLAPVVSLAELNPSFASVKLGSISGSLDTAELLKAGMTGGDTVQEMIDWYNKDKSVWNTRDAEDKWYAVNDAGGSYHAASIMQQYQNVKFVPATYQSGEGEKKLVVLAFVDGRLEELEFREDDSYRPVMAKDLKETYSVTPVIYSAFITREWYIPISESTIDINAETFSSITLDYTDIDNISDIKPAGEGGSKFFSKVTIYDMYGYDVDITEKASASEQEPALTDVELAEVSSAAYSGKEISPAVVCDGKTLKEGTDYTLRKLKRSDSFRNAGTYNLILIGEGDYTGADVRTFTIRKAANTMKVSGRTASVKYNKLKKRSQTVTASKSYKYSRKGQGAKTYKKVSVSSKKYADKFTVNRKNGRITVKKGLKKGTYRVRISVNAAGSGNYEPASKTVTVTVRVR